MSYVFTTHSLDYWCKLDSWTIFESVCLLEFEAVLAEKPSIISPDKQAFPLNNELYHMACRGIESGTLPRLKEGRFISHNTKVKPTEFLAWELQKGVSLPEEITARFDTEQLGVPSDKEQQLKNVKQRHRERCRTIAEYLWQQEATLTIEDMIQNDAINGIACENHTYSEKTLRNWIKDLCPNRKPGRRPNN